MREQFIKDETLIEISDEASLQLTVDVSFSSPSGAASLVTGTSVNGREFWRIQGTNQTYNQWDQERISKVAILNDE